MRTIVEERIAAPRDPGKPDAPRAARQEAVPRTQTYAPPRRRWPGILGASVLAAGLAALAVSSYYDNRSVGEKLDATVQNAQQTVQQGVADLKTNANAVARDGATVTQRAAGSLADARITAAVKTALAADPKLSAVKIDVTTDSGVVSLQGPAPDQRSRERAEVLAAAPSGVLRVDNRLVVPALPEATQR